MSSTDDEYFANYDGLQHAKHQLLRNYLGGWFPILSKSGGRVIYIDSHAGRGKHESGQDGSPLLAIKLLLNHRALPIILANTEVGFIFLEQDLNNYNCLCNEITTLGNLPTNIHVDCFNTDFEEKLRSVISDLHSSGQKLAPCFAFVDPFGFKLPMDLLNDLLSFERCELLINFMFRNIDMAMTHENQATNMDSLFGCQEWRALVNIDNYDIRANQIIDLFSNQLNANFVTHLKMLGTNGALKYVLFHATNHRKGREVMKQAIWSITPDGSFSASERTCPNQLVLISPEPDLEPLRKALWMNFAGKTVSMKELDDWLLGEMYIGKHLHQILREYKKKDIIQTYGLPGRFSFKNNPMIVFPLIRGE